MLLSLVYSSPLKILWWSEASTTEFRWAADRFKWSPTHWFIHVPTLVELLWSRRPDLRNIRFLKLAFIKVIFFCEILLIKPVWLLICYFDWALTRLICISRWVRSNRSFKFLNLVWICQSLRYKCMKLLLTALRLQKKNCIPTWLLPSLAPSLSVKFRL